MWWMKIDENLKSIDRYDGYHNGKSDKDNNTIRPKPHCPTAIFPFLPILLTPPIMRQRAETKSCSSKFALKRPKKKNYLEVAAII